MKTLRIIALLLAVLLCSTLAACGGGNTPAQSSATEAANSPASAADAETNAEGGYKVAFICKSFADTFCLNVMNEVQKLEGDYAGLFTVEYFDSEMNAEKQNTLIETCATNGFDAIIFQQVDAEAPVEVVKKAVEQGVFVVVTTGHIEDDGISWYVDADPYQQGAVVASYAIENGYCDDANVAILRGPAGNFHADQRFAAFEDALNAKDGATIVASEIADWSKDKGMTITQNWLVGISDLDVIFAANDDMGLGAVEAIMMAGREDEIKVFSIDGTEYGCEAVSEGTLMATVQQDAVGYAQKSLEIAAKLLRGENAESLNIDSTLVTPENVDAFLAIYAAG